MSTVPVLRSLPMTFGDILRIVLAFIVPPAAVATQVGFTGPFWLNLVIWLFTFGALGLPLLAFAWPICVIHAIWIIVTRK